MVYYIELIYMCIYIYIYIYIRYTVIFGAGNLSILP